MSTSSSNMRSLRSGFIGSISAWLPSRRSTAHQRGAWVIRRWGQVRSGRSSISSSWYGRYLWIGIGDACWAVRIAYGVTRSVRTPGLEPGVVVRCGASFMGSALRRRLSVDRRTDHRDEGPVCQTSPRRRRRSPRTRTAPLYPWHSTRSQAISPPGTECAFSAARSGHHVDGGVVAVVAAREVVEVVGDVVEVEVVLDGVPGLVDEEDHRTDGEQDDQPDDAQDDPQRTCLLYTSPSPRDGLL